MAQHYITKQGYEWNPLMKYGRNEPCICGSEKKFKKCCLRLMNPVVSHKTAQQIKAILKSGQKIRLSHSPHEKHANEVEAV